MKNMTALKPYQLQILTSVQQLGDDATIVHVADKTKELTGKKCMLGKALVGLHRLEEQGYLTSFRGNRGPESGGRFRRYRILTAGEGVLTTVSGMPSEVTMRERDRQSEVIFSKAMRLEAGQQQEFVDQACAGDKRLHEAVQSLRNGEILTAQIARGGLTFDSILNIAIGIAHELHCAHNAGIVQGDLKTENIMICPNGRIRLLNFWPTPSASKSGDITAAGKIMAEMIGNTEGLGSLSWIASRAASSDPGRRFSTAGAMQGSLEYLLDPPPKEVNPARAIIFWLGVLIAAVFLYWWVNQGKP